MSKGDTQKKHMALILRKYFKPEQIKPEHKGIQGRQFRFDWAIPDFQLAIEYEGLFAATSRHTSVAGYSGDCTKYNLATLQGWRVLRYTALTYQNLDLDLKIYKRNFPNDLEAVFS